MVDGPIPFLFEMDKVREHMDWLRGHVPAVVVAECLRKLAPHMPPEAAEFILVELAAYTNAEGILPDFGLAVAALVESMELAASAAAAGVPVDELPLGPHHGRRYASLVARKRAAAAPTPMPRAAVVEEPAAAPQTVDEVIASLGPWTPAEERTMRIYEHRNHGKPWLDSWGPHPELDADPAAVKPGDGSAEGGDK